MLSKFFRNRYGQNRGESSPGIGRGRGFGYGADGGGGSRGGSNN